MFGNSFNFKIIVVNNFDEYISDLCSPDKIFSSVTFLISKLFFSKVSLKQDKLYNLHVSLKILGSVLKLLKYIFQSI